MADFMNQQVNNKSNYGSEELIEHVGTSLLNGLGNLLEITSHEAKEDISGQEMPPVIITNERREKVKLAIYLKYTSSRISVSLFYCPVIV